MKYNLCEVNYSGTVRNSSTRGFDQINLQNIRYYVHFTLDCDSFMSKYNYAAIVTINGTNYQQVVSALRSFIVLFIIS